MRNQTTLEIFVNTCRYRGLAVERLRLNPVNEELPVFWDSALEGRSEVHIFEIHREATWLSRLDGRPVEPSITPGCRTPDGPRLPTPPVLSRLD